MKTEDDPGITYERCLAEEAGHLRRLRRWLTWLVRGRIAVLVAGITLAGEACSRHGHWGLAAAVSSVVFVALTVAIAVVEQRSKQREARVRYYEDGLARVQGRTIKDAPDGQRFADPAHPYAADLDIFGPSSIFSHLCMARTGTGQAMLARWLTQAAPIAEIAERQRAVAELSSRLSLRRDLWLAGGTVRERVREDALEDWLSGAITRIPRWQRIVTGMLGALGLVALYAFANPEAIPVALAIVLVQRLWVRRYRTLTKSVEAQVFRRAYELRVIARSIKRLCGERFSDPRLMTLIAGLSDAGQPASRHIIRLVRLVDWLESRRNQLFAIPAFVLLLPEQLCFAIESWRAQHGASASRWLATIGEMEALASLATFAFEHPDFPFPQLAEQASAPSLLATALGHPLIPASARVANDVRLDATCRLLVVTGSNMSGKSTLLRTVGVNAVLAMAGAPVCASQHDPDADAAGRILARPGFPGSGRVALFCRDQTLACHPLDGHGQAAGALFARRNSQRNQFAGSPRRRRGHHSPAPRTRRHGPGNDTRPRPKRAGRQAKQPRRKRALSRHPRRRPTTFRLPPAARGRHTKECAGSHASGGHRRVQIVNHASVIFPEARATSLLFSSGRRSCSTVRNRVATASRFGTMQFLPSTLLSTKNMSSATGPALVVWMRTD
jgi:hypothetical protein